MKRILLAAALLSVYLLMPAQGKISKDFKPVADSLAALMKERTGVKAFVQIKSVMKRGGELDFYFTQNLGDFPWRTKDAEWFRKELKKQWPSEYSEYSLGKVYAQSLDIAELEMPSLHSDGKPHESKSRIKDPGRDRFVWKDGEQRYDKGLSGRHIALWQSHGLYYDAASQQWRWQRAKNYSTVEDMYTQSYVLPFLIPMLENAGAYVMTPRERDVQKHEVVCDNDPAFEGARTGLLRRKGSYRESGSWESAGSGFADKKKAYGDNDNPFTMGTARQSKNGKVTWSAEIPEPGEYAVYVSYKSLKNSSKEARYRISHAGGTTDMMVDQRLGGGTWICLGIYEFEDKGSVTLSNDGGGVITADAVRFGGGMGKVVRGPKGHEEISGMPAYTEGALYNMQWSGIDSTILRKWDNDYTNDYATRGAWVRRMSGGSVVNPKEQGLGIPFDLSLAFHSDAGVTPNDSIVGTLAIYTLLCENSRKFASGEDRMINREYSDYIQSQVVSDIRTLHNPQWTRRQTWDRSYSECRTPGVPGMILELLAHQNFADMKYGMDPQFRFNVCRAVYKGMLKFLSNRYGCSYAVQPLPVNSFAVTLGGNDKAVLSWRATQDPLEPTAKPKGYILYTRVNDGHFDGGLKIETVTSGGVVSAEVPIHAGKLYSFKVVAYNDGGKSFPSEVLCAGVAGRNKVLIVNNFDRTSGPAWFDTPTYAGFDAGLDGGVPYMKDITYIGKMYQFRRQLLWTDDTNAGFGSSYTDEAGFQMAGNTFDYPVIHARALFGKGYSICSCSAAAFNDGSMEDIFATDIICGKQVTTPGAVQNRFTVFTPELQETLRAYKEKGGRLLVSGSNIGTDIWDMVSPVQYDSTFRAGSKEFVREVLGYKWLTGYASRTGVVKPWWGSGPSTGGLEPFTYVHEPSEKMYCVETPDGLAPTGKGASSFLRYGDTNISAAVSFEDGPWKAASIGFPLETIEDPDALSDLMERIFAWFSK